MNKRQKRKWRKAQTLCSCWVNAQWQYLSELHRFPRSLALSESWLWSVAQLIGPAPGSQSGAQLCMDTQCVFLRAEGQEESSACCSSPGHRVGHDLATEHHFPSAAAGTQSDVCIKQPFTGSSVITESRIAPRRAWSTTAPSHCLWPTGLPGPWDSGWCWARLLIRAREQDNRNRSVQGRGFYPEGRGGGGSQGKGWGLVGLGRGRPRGVPPPLGKGRPQEQGRRSASGARRSASSQARLLVFGRTFLTQGWLHTQTGPPCPSC